jgi:diguanylate cyclase (GGDEF)-like protein
MLSLSLRFMSLLSRRSMIVLAVLLVLLIGYADFVTGYYLSLGLFYVVPVALLAWYVSRRAGLVGAALSALTWHAVNAVYAPLGLAPAVLVWNSAVRFGFFSIIGFLLSSLKTSYERHSELARIDPLTGLLNSRAFDEALRLELARAQRQSYEIAVVYIDLDNFKSINDSMGHAAGDALLRDVGRSLTQAVRATDIVGRVGGDEFVVVLSSISAISARATAGRLQDLIHQVAGGHAPGVTATAGIALSDGTDPIDSLIERADALMYHGKATAKGSIQEAPQALQN